MSKLLQKPKSKPDKNAPGKFQRFSLRENPFPAEPAVNKDSADPRINGSIYEPEIRTPEYEKIVHRFLVQPQDNPNHLRLGYIIDTSYIGRGNGKSAFLVNLQNTINKEFCLDLSDGMNRCFSLYVTPQLGGRTKTYPDFIDVLFAAILETKILESSLATLRLEAIIELYPEIGERIANTDEKELIKELNSEDWFRDNGVDSVAVANKILENEFLQALPEAFPLCVATRTLFNTFTTQQSFAAYYAQEIKKPKDKLDFAFSHLVSVFLAAGFNGSYVLIDNFEHIPIYQSAKQKLDFAFELRSTLFDGNYLGSRLGFYNFLLVFHAGVPRLISEAWSASGMENRSPISSPIASNHIIAFEKLGPSHVALLLREYLREYRTGEVADPLSPFTMEAVNIIGPRCEFNASKILRLAFDLLEKLADTPNKATIDAAFVNELKEVQEDETDKPVSSIEDAETVDLVEKAGKE